MPYLLNSGIVIYYSNKDAGIEEYLERLMIDGIAMSTVTLMEVLTGISASAQPLEAQTRIEELAATIPILPFGEIDARR